MAGARRASRVCHSMLQSLQTEDFRKRASDACPSAQEGGHCLNFCLNRLAEATSLKCLARNTSNRSICLCQEWTLVMSRLNGRARLTEPSLFSAGNLAVYSMSKGSSRGTAKCCSPVAKSMVLGAECLFNRESVGLLLWPFSTTNIQV